MRRLHWCCSIIKERPTRLMLNLFSYTWGASDHYGFAIDGSEAFHRFISSKDI